MDSDGLVSIVIPVYRSEKYLEATVAEIKRTFFSTGGRLEIILVNDGSPDDVERVMERMAAEDPRVRGVTLGRNVGQHRATLQGLAMVRGEVAVTLDDDGQNPPEAALAVIGELRARDLDVVYGRFQSVEQTLLRRLASAMNRWLSRHTIGNRSDLAITNVRAIRGDLARALGRIESPYPYIDALIFRMTRYCGEVEVQHRDRREGESNYGLRALIRLWISHLTSLTILPLRLAMIGSFGVSVLGFLMGVIEMVLALKRREAPPGWLSLFVSVTFLFSVLFAFLGIVSAYLGRMYVSLNERGLVWVRARHGEANAPGEERTAETGAGR